ncbi:MAG: hypothetical protein JW810_04950 [Sedimentisphaerales bacterium]|nr:hypothetical protein [Sedimentisphaerales bacterium]
MNRNQKITLAIGVALVVLSGLFPPYEGEWSTGKDTLGCRLGHYPFFSPPNARDVSKLIRQDSTYRFTNFDPRTYRAHILFAEVAIQLSVIALATTGVTLLLAKRKT